jgi:hypothetical protein
MNTQKVLSISGIILLSLAVSAGVLILIYALQNPQVMVNLASIGWNG